MDNALEWILRICGHQEVVWLILSVLFTFATSSVVLYLHDQQTYHNEQLYDLGFEFIFPVIPWKYFAYFEPVVWLYGGSMILLFWTSAPGDGNSVPIDAKVAVWKKYLCGLALMYGMRAVTILLTIQPSPCGKQGTFYADNMYSGHTIFVTSTRLLAVTGSSSWSCRQELSIESLITQVVILAVFFSFKHSSVIGTILLCVICLSCLALRSRWTALRLSYVAWYTILCLIIALRMHYTADIAIGLIVAYMYCRCFSLSPTQSIAASLPTMLV
jgi:hypothetical protein